jgi:uncharacterized protein (TIGR02246 family)
MISTNVVSDEAQILAGIADRVQAIRSKDVDRLMANYAPDVATFDIVTPLRNIGSGPVRKRVVDWFSSFRTPIEYEIQNVSLAISGDVAFDHHLTNVHGTSQTGQTIDMWFRETVGYRKVEGRWRITHQHSSVPIDMENGRGRVDLRP